MSGVPTDAEVSAAMDAWCDARAKRERWQDTATTDHEDMRAALVAAWNRRALPSVEVVAKVICREKCAFYGEPPCWEIGPWPHDQCDEPGCMAKASAVLRLLGGEE